MRTISYDDEASPRAEVAIYANQIAPSSDDSSNFTKPFTEPELRKWSTKPHCDQNHFIIQTSVPILPPFELKLIS
jgi:hypothetical protein